MNAPVTVIHMFLKLFQLFLWKKNIFVRLLLFNTKKMLIDIVYFPISSIILMLLNKYIFNFITRCYKLKLKNENELEWTNSCIYRRKNKDAGFVHESLRNESNLLRFLFARNESTKRIFQKRIFQKRIHDTNPRYESLRFGFANPRLQDL